jgi:DNA modification methylase
MSGASASGPISTNQPSTELPFQRWFKFKEAFSPQLVLDVLHESGARKVSRCLDPFGGCGTTGLTCQFAGVHPVLIEVNPFIADLAEAKLARYDLETLSRDFVAVRDLARRRMQVDMRTLGDAPQTLCEPGDGNRWVFPKEVLTRLLQYRAAIEGVESETNRRLLRVLLGSIVVGVSNVTVNGKGRKYRGSWMEQQRSSRDVDQNFQAAFLNAIGDIQRYGIRPTATYDLLRGSCLHKVTEVEPCDLAVFSPPYPNSFDYTDIYNLELWVLGYLKTKDDNRALRQATLRSHIQAGGQYRYNTARSAMLRDLLSELSSQREELWDERIADMVGAYFEDMQRLLVQLRSTLVPGGRAIVVIGESCYAGTKVRAGHITAQIARSEGFKVKRHTRLRTMRVSAQQGGERDLEERLVELVND